MSYQFTAAGWLANTTRGPTDVSFEVVPEIQRMNSKQYLKP